MHLKVVLILIFNDELEGIKVIKWCMNYSKQINIVLFHNSIIKYVMNKFVFMIIRIELVWKKRLINLNFPFICLYFRFRKQAVEFLFIFCFNYFMKIFKIKLEFFMLTVSAYYLVDLYQIFCTNGSLQIILELQIMSIAILSKCLIYVHVFVV